MLDVRRKLLLLRSLQGSVKDVPGEVAGETPYFLGGKVLAGADAPMPTCVSVPPLHWKKGEMQI